MPQVTERLETPAFTIEPGEVTRQAASSSRTMLSFAAAAARHFDGAFEVSVNAIVFDAQGRFIGRRSGDRSKTVLGNRAAWSHEIDNDWLAQAANVTYEIEHRFDYRRRVVAGELPPLAVDADASDYYRWLNLDPRTLEDRAVRYDFGLWVRSSELVITISQRPMFVTDSCRSELELDLLDDQRQLCFSRPFNVSLNYGQPAYDDTSISMDRRAMRSLRFFELRGRTEARNVARIAVDLRTP